MTLTSLGRAGLLACAWLSTGCVSATRNHAILQPWVGHAQTELMAAWGPPERTYADGYGGKVLIYEHTSAYISPGSVIPAETGKFIVEESETSMLTHRQVLYVTRDGTIYLWRRE